MRSLLHALVVAAALLPCGAAHPQPAVPDSASDTVVLWGRGYSFTVSSYDGWLIEGTDSPLGIVARLRPPPGDSTQAYGYVTVDQKPSAAGLSFGRAIENTLAAFRQMNPTLQVSLVDTLRTGDGKQAPTALFVGSPTTRAETCAFIDEDSVTVRIGCVARYQRELPLISRLLQRVVRSYIFLGLRFEEN